MPRLSWSLSVLIKNKIAFEERKHTESKILSAKEVIKSPGIPETAAIVKKIRKKKNRSGKKEKEKKKHFEKTKKIG